jgi:hypothetical protein
VAAVGTLAVLPGAASTVLSGKTEQANGSTPAKSSDQQQLPADFSGPLVAHVRDYTTGEISLMVGTKEVVYRDQELVNRMIMAARR